MQAFNPGDLVSVIHDTIRGKVIRVEKFQVFIEDDDGFERSYRIDELTVLSNEKHYKNIDAVNPKEEETKQASNGLWGQPEKTTISEVDLHIENLLDTTAGMTNHEIVQYQLSACRSFIQQSIEKKRKKIVLIHGKGQGVLKGEIRQYLNGIQDHSPIRVDYHDADYQRYGIGGATEVILFYSY